MRGKDRERSRELIDALGSFNDHELALPGLQPEGCIEAFVGQLLESRRRVEYIRVITQRDVSGGRADPSSPLFDPIKAAIRYHRESNLDEAFWLTFLSVHFGRHRIDGWRLCGAVYGGLGHKLWNWRVISGNPRAFQTWLRRNSNQLTGYRFGNHRKYESLRPDSGGGTHLAFESYVDWVNPGRNHVGLLENCRTEAGDDAAKMFDNLYESMRSVVRFGRTARFDYLTMVGKLGLAPIEPGIPYMDGATGPLRGARLLLGGAVTFRLGARDADEAVARLGRSLGLGMQVLEDALCNWQKSPRDFKPFRG